MVTPVVLSSPGSRRRLLVLNAGRSCAKVEDGVGAIHWGGAMVQETKTAETKTADTQIEATRIEATRTEATQTEATQTEYTFNRKVDVGTQRTRSLADEDLPVLLTALEVTPAIYEHDLELHRTLLQFCTAIPVNIAWYKRRLKSETWRQRVYVGATAVIGLLVIALSIAPTLKSAPTSAALGSQAIIAAQIAVLGAGAMAALQVLASVVDVKARIGAFWKASADLQEILFGFQEHWVRRVTTTNGVTKVSDEFRVALGEAIRQARRVSREERDTFFGSFRSPTDVAASVSASLDLVRGKRQDLVTLQQAAATARSASDDAFAAKLQVLHETVLDTRAAVAGAKARLDANPQGAAAERPAAQTAFAVAMAEQARAEERERLHVASRDAAMRA
jgi:hypothetical protein